nr:HNH endonuclease signature motif containing protein [Arthrobacter sp. TB 26]
MNTATNPRTQAPDAGVDAAAVPWADHGNNAGPDVMDVPLDLRSRPQKLLDGLVGACKLALAAGTLPGAGGLRPQVMVTIDYRDLLTRLNAPGGTSDTHDGTRQGGTREGGSGDSFQRGQVTAQTGSLLFTGPVTASTVRKIACDADIIPVLLGSAGQVLDIGRATRVFPPHIRKALTVRDQGCAFPGCTIPALWCEAHHITYWSRGGTTGTDNGVLLCSHHHHVIHKEHWTIQVRTGIPWFIPPPHLDPRQRPRRNHYFHPATLDTPGLNPPDLPLSSYLDHGDTIEG